MERIDSAGSENSQLAEEIETHRAEAEDPRPNWNRAPVSIELLKPSMSLKARCPRLARNAKASSSTDVKVAITKVELRLENLVAAVLERHDVELSNFEPDSHALLVCIDAQKNGSGRGRTRVVQPAPAEEEQEERSRLRIIRTTRKRSPSRWSMPPRASRCRQRGRPDKDFVETCVADLKRLDSMKPVMWMPSRNTRNSKLATTTSRSYEDLVSSKEELLRVIEKINIETERRFGETFTGFGRTSARCSRALVRRARPTSS